MTHLAFIDTETTGLDLNRHQIWELALIIEGHANPANDGEWLWQLPIDASRLDPMAARVNGFYDRYTFSLVDPDPGLARKMHKPSGPVSGNGLDSDVLVTSLQDQLVRLLRGAHLVGAVPDFDAYRLAKILPVPAPWHYHLIDIEALMVGFLAGRASRGDLDAGLGMPDLPWKSDALSEACGVEPPTEEDRHTALGDARWAQRVYHTVIGDAE